MISGTNLVNGKKSEYTYNGLYARVKKTSDAAATTYMPDYLSSVNSDLVTQISAIGTVNAVYGQGYGRISQRFTPEAGTNALSADTYFQHDLYGSTLFAVDTQGVIKHHAAHDIWGMPKTVCGDSGIASGLRFTAYDYDSVLDKHFALARMYDPSQGRMLGVDPVKRGLNGYAYCSNDPVNQIDPTGEIANVLLGGVAGGIIGGAAGFAGSALSQLAEGRGFSAKKAWGATANGAIVGAARGALVSTGAGAALGVNFVAGMAGSLAEQKISQGHISPVRAVVDGVFNAVGGRLYGKSPLRNAKNDFIRGALEGAVKGGAYNIADVLDNKLKNAYDSGSPQSTTNSGAWNRKAPRPNESRSPQLDCIRSKPFNGTNCLGRRSRGGNTSIRNDQFRLGNFVKDVVFSAVMGGLASVTFYGVGRAILRATGQYIDELGCWHNKVSDYLYGDKLIVEGDPLIYSMKNRNGGTIVVSTDTIRSYNFIKTMDFYNQQGQKINIISGTHGTRGGRSAFGFNRFWKIVNTSLAEIEFYEEDIEIASRYKNVEVYNIISLSTTELKGLLNSRNVTICAWCFSERSKDAIKAIK